MKKISKGASLILVYGDKVLMQLRDDIPNISYPNHWGFAGSGHLEDGETFLEAAQRELKEETGYVSKDPHHLMSVEYEVPDGRTIQAERFFEIYDEKQEIKCMEGQKIEFLSVEDIKDLKAISVMVEGMEKAIEAAKNLKK